MKKIYILFFLFFATNLYSQFNFVSTYDQWKSKENHFVEFLDDKDQARVIFIGSKVFSSDGKGKKPTVSEGMAYGLLLSYANDDQHLFDKFLRYIIDACNKYGCVDFTKDMCYQRSFFLMPWMLDYKSEPFYYKPQKDSTDSYFSSGSATDADIQIAWALSLVMKRVKKGKWKNHYFRTFFGKADYKNIFYQIVKEIRLYDIDWDKKIILPGSQWGDTGKNVFFAGYFTPQAFEALDTAPIVSASNGFEKEKNSKAYSLVIQNNSAKKIFVDLEQDNANIHPDFYFIKTKNTNFHWIPPLSKTRILFTPKNSSSNINLKIAFNNNSKKKAEYTLIAKNQKWDVVKKQFSTKSDITIQNDRALITIKDKTFSKLQFSFSEVMINSAQVIKTFQEKHNTGLVPNILYFDGKYPSKWEKAFSYDAIRYILWTTPFLSKNPHIKGYDLLKNVLDNMTKSLLPFIKKSKNGWTLPPEGINVFTNEANNGWKHVSPALNAPLFLYAYYQKDKSLMEKLAPNIENYSIVNKQPSIFDPPNDSSAYYASCMILIIQAIIEEKLE